MKLIIPIEPMGKPRQTRSDKWKQRPCVMAYRAFADELRLKVGKRIPSRVGVFSWEAYISMPESWSKKKKEAMKGKPHQQTPDKDNIEKAILDALFKSDSGVWSGYSAKRWDDGAGARIEISYD